MPDFLVSAATGALNPVIYKLGALLHDEYKRFKGVHGEVKFLIRELDAMHAFLLEKSKEENPDAQDKAWMKEVRELSYDIEDSLDEFRVRIDDESTKPDGFIDKCKKLLAKTKTRRRIAKAIQGLNVQVKEVSERNARYRSSETIMKTSKETVDTRALAIFEDASRLVGIDLPKQELISFLTQQHGCIPSQQPKIVCIVGIGGIGKTTLANQVYEELKEQFQCRVFFSVSRNPDMVKILRTIVSQVTNQRYRDIEAWSIQQLIIEINEFLRTKRYLVIADDVWDVESWNTIKCTLPNNSCGSVIITTTRRHDVARACCSLYPGWVYQPKPLEEHDSKRLFHNRIFGPENECQENLKEVSDKILKKCGGLPLAIITISGLLANKARNGVHSVTEWDHVQASIGHGLERDASVEGMMGILSLSYFDLPYHLKACLLYLSVFPEDTIIERGHLVRMWAAEGFILAESTCTLYESGEKYFNELINRNLILPVKINRITGEVDFFLVHDTILDFIVCKSVEDNFVTINGIPGLTPPPGMKVRRLSIQGETEGDVALHLNQQSYANVRSIVSFGPLFSFLGCRFLRVLDLMGCRRLDSHHLANLGELLQLRYLGLTTAEEAELPEQIGELQYLETLELRRNCSTTLTLPTTIVGLKRLANLLVESTSIPCGIKNLQALEVLTIVIHIGDIEAATVFAEEISELTKMVDLGIEFLVDSGCYDEEASCMELIKRLVSSLQRLNKLKNLCVKYRHKTRWFFNRDAIMADVPWCSDRLRKLVFTIGHMPRLPSWMESLVNIEELELRVLEFDQESLGILGCLPVIVSVSLVIQTVGKGMASTDKQQLVVCRGCGCKRLRYFHIVVQYLLSTRHFGIPMLMFEAGSMPELEELRIDFDADTTIDVTNGHLDFGLNHLSRLKYVGCLISGSKWNAWRVETAIEKALDNHPKCPTFEKFPRLFGYDLTLTEDSQREQPSAPKAAKVKTVDSWFFCEVIQEAAEHVTCTSDDKVSYSTSAHSMTAALPLPMDLRFTIHHHGASPTKKHASHLGPRRGQQRRRSKTRQGIAQQVPPAELVQGALAITDRVKGTSGSPASDGLGPQLTAAPQQQTFFTFNAGSSNAEAEQQALACHEPQQYGIPASQSSAPSSWDSSTFCGAFNSLSLSTLSCNDSGTSATVVETGSDTGAPASYVLEPSTNSCSPETNILHTQR